MTGLDTNVLVRYVMQENVKQSPEATKIIEALKVDAPGFVSLIAVVELGWVLTTSEGLTRSQFGEALDVLLRTKETVVDRADQVLKALRTFKKCSADFADCLIERAFAAAGCNKTMTFDIGATKTAGMKLIQ